MVVDIFEQLGADQIAAEHEKQIHAGPTERGDGIHAEGDQRLGDAVIGAVVKHQDKQDRQRPEMIQSVRTLATLIQH